MRFLLALGLAWSLSSAAPAPSPSPSPSPSASPSHSPSPSVDEIVRRAIAAQARTPQNLSCVLSLRAWELDADGKAGEELATESEVSWAGGELQHGKTLSRSYAGKPFGADEMKQADREDEKKRKDQAEREQKGEGLEAKPMFTAFRPPLHDFKLLREETLEGRRTWVLSLEPKASAGSYGRSGTVWIDAETFVPLKGSYVPRPLPNHVDKLEIEERFARTAQGETVPVRQLMEAKGGFWFFKKRARILTEWRDCKPR